MSSHGLTGGRAPPSAPLDAPYPAKPLSKLLSTQPSPLRQPSLLDAPSAHQPPLAAPRGAIVQEMLAQVAAGAEDAFFVVDVGAALDRLALWRRLLPDVEPFYAVKCCPDPVLLYALARAGIGFDCASQAEMASLFALGVDPSRVLYANPCKQPSHLRYAARHRVPLAVVDSEDELRKHAELYPGGELLLRIAVDDSQAACVMSCKYGAPHDASASLLRAAADLGLRVRGVSFHVGSGCYAPDAFVDAVERASAVFDEAEAAGLPPLDVLDIGGGFPGVDSGALSFEDIATPLRRALDRVFPASRGVRLIAEPGRFLAAATHTLAVNVIGKKAVAPPADAAAAEPATMYFVNDGLYGSFNCVLYDHAHPEPLLLPTPPVAAAAADGAPALASIWGPTCDGLDCVVKETRLPPLPVGQSSWLYFEDMGAYTAAAGSTFNGMPLPTKVYLQPPGVADGGRGGGLGSLGLGLSLGLDLGLLHLDQFVEGVVVGVDALVVDLLESDGDRVAGGALVDGSDGA